MDIQIKSITAFRLLPGADLKKSILDQCKENKIEAGILISGVGSLSQASLRLADGQTPEHFKGPLEIVSLTGTCSLHGAHIHISLADSKGQVIGGHLLENNLIYTTAEIAILNSENHIFHRKQDPQTGYLEIDIQTKKSSQI